MADETPFLIINPNADNMRTGKQIDKILSSAKKVLGDFRYELTTEIGDGINLAKKAQNEGYKTIVAIGGDGTVNEVANVVINTDIKIGMIARGGACEAHKTHGIPRDLDRAFEIIATGYHEKFPVGFAKGDTDRYFIEMIDGAFTGLCAEVANYRMKWLHGDMRYILLAFQMALFSYKPVPSRVTVDGKEIREVSLSAFGVALTDFLGGFEFIPGNHPRKGDFAVIICRDLKGLRLIINLMRALNGKHIKHKKVEILRGKHVVIESERPMFWEAEGEIFSKESTRIEAEYVPNAVNLIIPEGWQYGLSKAEKKAAVKAVLKGELPIK